MDFNKYLKHVNNNEWILTNNRGGYALGYGNLLNERKYNSLLVASDEKLKRNHLVFSQEELVNWEGSDFFLDSNSYLDCIYPDGHKSIIKNWIRPYPAILYSSRIKREDILILKEIFMHPRKNITVVKFSNLGKNDLELILKPKFSLRDHHAVNPPGFWKDKKIDLKIHENYFSLGIKEKNLYVFTYVEKGVFEENMNVYRDNYYPMEASRGYDGVEDLISPVEIKSNLIHDSSNYIVYSDSKIDNLEEAVKQSINRYKKYPFPKDHPRKKKIFDLSSIEYANNEIFNENNYKKLLEMMMEDFCLKNNIIAGYPWFSAWGRDTMICLGAMLKNRKLKNKVYKILENYGENINNGLIPNIIGEGGVGTNYNSVDASLWFVVRLYQAVNATVSKQKIKKYYDYAVKIILGYYFRDDEIFYLDDDGLLEIKESGKALTWMDAIVHSRPVTPRYGKCIEINALWYNALKGLIYLAEQLNLDSKEILKYRRKQLKLKQIGSTIKKIENNAHKFILKNHLVDRIKDEKQIDEHRPNSIIAISLPFKLFDKSIMEEEWKRAEKKLLTPFGLRSLSPDESSFKRKYLGEQTMRDLAYHQGTVWTWLLGSFVISFIDIFESKMKKAKMIDIINSIVQRYRVDILKGHFASVAEIWDGDGPSRPKGTPAQAWSVAALLEIEELTEKLKEQK